MEHIAGKYRVFGEKPRSEGFLLAKQGCDTIRQNFYTVVISLEVNRMLAVLVVLFIGWASFVCSTVNVIYMAREYVRYEGKPVDFGLMGRVLATSLTLCVWNLLVFYVAPLLWNTRNL